MLRRSVGITQLLGKGLPALTPGTALTGQPARHVDRSRVNVYRCKTTASVDTLAKPGT